MVGCRRRASFGATVVAAGALRPDHSQNSADHQQRSGKCQEVKPQRVEPRESGLVGGVCAFDVCVYNPKVMLGPTLAGQLVTLAPLKPEHLEHYVELARYCDYTVRWLEVESTPWSAREVGLRRAAYEFPNFRAV